MKKLRVLILDDDRDFAESIAEALEIHGHELRITFTGEEAIRIFREQDFDIVFMDLRLPGMNGVECCTEIRKIKPDARVVIMTAYSNDHLFEQALKSGAMEALRKPLKIKNILELLDKTFITPVRE